MAVCWLVAVVCSLATGLQYGSGASWCWPVMLGAAAIATAALPSRRMVAIATAIVGVVSGLWAAWLVRNGAVFDAADVLEARGAAALVVASGLLLAASLLRALWA